MLSKSILLVSGCSHTYGVGIDSNHSWSNVLSQHLELDLVNLSKPGACAQYVCDTLKNWLDQNKTQPKLVIAQWPNPYRTMKIINHQTVFYTRNSMDEDFRQRLKHCPESFLREWQQSVESFNQYCKSPLINVCFESFDSDIAAPVTELLQKDISVYIDEKTPGHTWFFDSAALDKLHHSEWCHQKWADRILTIVENVV